MRYTIQDFHNDFPDNAACLEYLFMVRFPDTKCPECGRVNAYHKHPTRPCWTCNCGQSHIFPKKGTIFEKSSTDLVKWFYAIFLMSQSRNGVAAKELERHIGVTYKCAWRIAKKVRELMTDSNFTLSGEVEADETYIGGVRRGAKYRGSTAKTVVYGMVERGGKVQAEVVPHIRSTMLGPISRSSIAAGSRLITDQLAVYKSVTRWIHAREHSHVNHSAGEYARKSDNAHTNTIEGFWSQLKRSISGTYHVVSPKYLPLYVSEFEFRYNARGDGRHLFDLLIAKAGLQPVSIG